MTDAPEGEDQNLALVAAAKREALREAAAIAEQETNKPYLALKILALMEDTGDE